MARVGVSVCFFKHNVAIFGNEKHSTGECTCAHSEAHERVGGLGESRGESAVFGGGVAQSGLDETDARADRCHSLYGDGEGGVDTYASEQSLCGIFLREAGVFAAQDYRAAVERREARYLVVAGKEHLNQIGGSLEF